MGCEDVPGFEAIAAGDKVDVAVVVGASPYTCVNAIGTLPHVIVRLKGPRRFSNLENL